MNVFHVVFGLLNCLANIYIDYNHDKNRKRDRDNKDV